MTHPLWTIGKLSRQAEVPARTIRFYEQAGLMPEPARSNAGYRIYSAAELRRLRLIKQARALGLSIPQTKELVHRAFDMECAEYQGEVVSIIQQRLSEVERRLHELRGFQQDLRALLDHVGHLEASPGRRVADCAFCPLIDDDLHHDANARIRTRTERRPRNGLPVP